MNYTVGIDIGTSSCKTVVVDMEGEIVASASQDYLTKTNASGGAVQDPMDWYRAALDTLKQCAHRSKIDLHKVVAVGCSGQMQGATFIGSNGNVLTDSMIWHDMTPINETKQLNRKHKDLFLKHCNFPCTTALSVSKLVWIKHNQPQLFEKLDKFLFAPSFITYQLTGTMVSDISNLGYSGLNSVEENDWSKELLQTAGIPERILPPLHNCNDIVGTVSSVAAKQSGLLEGTPVIAGCGDGPAECYSVGIEGKNQLKIRLGSASSINAVFLKSEYSGPKNLAFPHISKDYIALNTYTAACARSVKWLRETMYCDRPQTDETYVLMDGEGSTSPLGAHGILYHPYLSGDGNPYSNPDLRAKFTGINAGHMRNDFVRAVYEGVSLGIRDALEAIPVMWTLPEAVYVGGGTKSALWMQILVDILGKDGTIPKYGDASYGIALLAGDAVGLLDGVEAAEKSKKNGRRLQHNPEHHAAYQAIYERYKRYAFLEYNSDHTN